MPYDSSSGGDIPIPSNSSKESLILLGHKINAIDNLLQLFEDNCDNRIGVFKENMSEIFKTVPISFPPKNKNKNIRKLSKQ